MDWTVVMELVVLCAVGAVCMLVLPWLKERLGAEQLKNLWKWVCLAVQAAEKLFGSGTGEQKKAFALDTLHKKGVKTDDATLEVLIEAAVKELT